MISVDAALAHLLDLVAPLDVEHVPLRRANGRVLAQPITARRMQPPFDASSMDGYALRRVEVESGAMFEVVGEAAAGHAFVDQLRPGQAVRIFTGAPLPPGADFVVIQEDVMRRGDVITLGHDIDGKANVRLAGSDFRVGETLSAPRVLRPADIALLAAMNAAQVPVTRKPKVAILATGDELVQPGEIAAADQIIASNNYGLAALLEGLGAETRLLPIAKDNAASLRQGFELSRGADLLVTIGGASVGDHDLVGSIAAEMGLERSFYKVAMRPGKPLMAGRLDHMAMVGLPGNPVSAMVCGTVFLAPMVRKMLGMTTLHAPLHKAPLACDLGQNGPRVHYMRARIDAGTITPNARQDSALLSVLNQANALLIRPAHDPAQRRGVMMPYIKI
ncbi:MAG: gephyrin-like molybdotransferase Glp [Pseudomonadota bacterium]